MKTLRNIASAAAVTLGLSGTANAALFEDVNLTTFNVIIDWFGTPFTEELTPLPVAYDFNVSLLEFSGSGSDQVGYFFDFGGTRLSTSTTACDPAGGNFVGGCDVVTGTTPIGTTLFSGLSAGTYDLGCYYGGTPEFGRLVLQFSKVAPVPLPAAGFLLLGALGGLGLARRRAKRA